MGFHSREEGSAKLEMSGRCEARASHRMNIKNSVAKNDIVAPIDDIRFHLENASG